MQNDENPTQAQWAPKNQHPPTTPLVLIHDGGGTTFSYHILESLYRDVWAIHNPHFFSAEPWEGGMDEMARHYIHLIKKAGITGNIFLGGWSLGGFLSMTVARLIADGYASTGITVKGMVFIDSPMHLPWKDLAIENSSPVLPNLPILVAKSLANCEGLLHSWQLPAWDVEAYKGRKSRFSVEYPTRSRSNVVVPAGHVWYQPLKGNDMVMPVAQAQPPESEGAASESPAAAKIPPTTVLLRCVYKTESTNKAKPARVDMFREKPLLGWNEHYPEFIKAVIDVDATHYNLFEFDKINTITDQINMALSVLESQKIEEL